MVPVKVNFFSLRYYFGLVGLSGTAGFLTVSCWCYLWGQKEALPDEATDCLLVRCG